MPLFYSVFLLSSASSFSIVQIFRIQKMPAAYAIELRQRAVAHYKETDSTQIETAEIFNIGVSTLRS